MHTRCEDRIDAVLKAELEPGGPGAAVAVIQDGEFVHRKAYGLANLEWNLPLEPDAVFRIASLTKQFTAVAIMMLAERGKLSIDAPIETYLPDWPARGRTITVRRLLNHTSGVWSHDSTQIDRTKRPNPPVEEVIELIYSQPFEFEPGERYSYNNSGYLLL
ncbi:MAG TPA: serine hydrolase domain-containing protein, partial [Caulobacteraceae bacterium]|nr:serine hydrolase domain-containing protein [Caulobacteraceae bacterium]